MFPAPPRQKGDRVPALGACQGEGTVCGAKKNYYRNRFVLRDAQQAKMLRR